MNAWKKKNLISNNGREKFEHLKIELLKAQQILTI